MTRDIHIVLCDIGGVTVPCAAFESVFEAVALRNSLARKAAFPQQMIGDYRMNFRIEPTQLVDMQADVDAQLALLTPRVRRAMDLSGDVLGKKKGP